MAAPSWKSKIGANLHLNFGNPCIQLKKTGFAALLRTWSMTVIMKVDLVGPVRRGLATGINEAAGYGALALTALLTGAVLYAFYSRLRPSREEEHRPLPFPRPQDLQALP